MALVTLKHHNGLSITLSSFGASWLSCILPTTPPREVLLGCDPVDLSKQTVYFGATLGRYANRIAAACYTLAGKTYVLSANQQGKHTLHGGEDNFSYRQWGMESVSDCHVTFVTYSADKEKGFNGHLTARVTYTLFEDSITIDYAADCDQISICALSNHAYFCLDGGGDGRVQRLCIPSEYYLPLDKSGIPNAALSQVVNTAFDFRKAKPVIQDFDKSLEPMGGYDHDWYFGENGTKKLACELQSADEKIRLDLYTTQPALRFYSGNFLHGSPTRDGSEYADFAGVALEPGVLANSPNLPDFLDDCLIGPRRPYRHSNRYCFKWR